MNIENGSPETNLTEQELFQIALGPISDVEEDVLSNLTDPFECMSDEELRDACRRFDEQNKVYELFDKAKS